MITAEPVLAGPDLTPAAILSRAVGPWPFHCAGYPLDPAGGVLRRPAARRRRPARRQSASPR